MHRILPFLLGVLFSIGLCVSHMSRPSKVLAFLDLSPNWDPSLALVMAGATGVYMANFLIIRNRPEYQKLIKGLPRLTHFDFPLIAGAVIFGIGWGMVGLCPGPAVTALASFVPEVFVFTLCMAFGMATENAIESSYPNLFTRK